MDNMISKTINNIVVTVYAKHNGIAYINTRKIDISVHADDRVNINSHKPILNS